MKYLKILTIAVFGLLLFGACKKDTPIDKNVTASDLAGHYVAVEAKMGNYVVVRLVNFYAEGGVIKADWYKVNDKRSATVTISENTFSFDLFDTGADIYVFNFSKNASGGVMLNSLKSEGPNNIDILHAEMYNSKDIPNWGGKTFELLTEPYGNIYSKYIKFSENKTKVAFARGLSNMPEETCIVISNNAGFKTGRDANAINTLGIFVPSWKGDTNVKLLETLTSNNYGYATCKLYN
jgi:hypothetical protein